MQTRKARNWHQHMTMTLILLCFPLQTRERMRRCAAALQSPVRAFNALCLLLLHPDGM